MEITLKLLGYAWLPIAASVILKAADLHTPFKNLPKLLKQILFGILFGACTVFGCEYGLTDCNVFLHVADAAPLCGGLIFGAPAGILAGVIGGVYSLLTAKGILSVAGSVTLVIAGLLGAAVHRFLYIGKNSKWFYGIALGILVEDIRMLLVFLTNTDSLSAAYSAVSVSAIPMAVANAACVAFAMIGSSLVAREPLIVFGRPLKIQTKIRAALFLCMLAAFVSIFVIINGVLRNLAIESTKSTVKISVDDTESNLERDANATLVTKSADVIRFMKQESLHRSPDVKEFTFLVNSRQFSEGTLIANNGEILVSTDEYIASLQNISEYPLDSFESEAGASLPFSYRYYEEKGDYFKYFFTYYNTSFYVLFGLNTEQYRAILATSIEQGMASRHIGENGFVVVLAPDGRIVSSSLDAVAVETVSEETETDGEETETDFTETEREPNLFETLAADADLLQTCEINGEKYYTVVDEYVGYRIIGLMRAKEADLNTNISLYLTTLIEVFIFFLVYVILFFLIKRTVITPLERVNGKLDRICGGELEEKVDEFTSYEMKTLSDDINSTVDALKEHMGKEAKLIQKELNFAKEIQHSALPSTFPPFPAHKEIDLYATMNTAKEVGGDFYDFYLLDERHLCVLIADVSGKGIPAALFMMQAKSVIKSLMETKCDVDVAFTQANEELCKNNSAQMFVTAWIGVLDLETGDLSYANAGHNSPLIQSEKEFTYLKSRAGFVLAGMEGIQYKMQTAKLHPGDSLYLYTDGVTEATSEAKELYGEERLLEKVNGLTASDAETFCKEVNEAVNAFTGEAEQADDITMLYLKYLGKA